MRQLAVAIEISSDGSGGLRLHARPVDSRFRLDSLKTTVVLTVWLESSDTLRGRLENLANGALGYFQGNATLIEFARDAGLRASASVESARRDNKTR